MRIIIADDERAALDDIKEVVSEVVKDSEIDCVNNYIDCIKRAEANKYDIAFLDISMPGKDGLQLAKLLKEINPKTNIIFVTGYSQYAVDAFRINASGYILKPARKSEVLNAINNLRIPVKYDTDKLKIQCFGKFECYYKDEKITFKRALSKELFAYLVNLRGASADTNELCAVLFDDDTNSNKHYLRNIISDLKSSLLSYGIKDVFIYKRNNFSIDISKVDCDFYRYLNYETDAVNSYYGEYMKQYSWAEMTNGLLYPYS